MKGWKIALIGVILILLVIVSANLPSFNNPTNVKVYTVRVNNEVNYNSLQYLWEYKNFAYTKTQSFGLPSFSVTSPTANEVTVECWLVRNSDGARSQTKIISIGEFDMTLGDKGTAEFIFTGVPEGEYTAHFQALQGYILKISEERAVIVSDATPPEQPKSCSFGDIGCYMGSALSGILGPVVNALVVLGMIAIGILLLLLFIVIMVVRK